MDKLIIIGVSETAERIFTFCQLYNLYEVVGFAVNKEYRKIDTLHGLPVWNIEDLSKYIDIANDFIFIALFWNHLNGDRRRLYEQMKSRGYRFANIISPRASVRGIIGENCWLMDFVVVQEGAQIGDNVIIADNVFVGNLGYISDHCFIGAKSTIMGSSKIGMQTFVGIGATVFEGITIGNMSLVGACTIVKQDIPDCTVIKAEQVNNKIKNYCPDEMEKKMIAQWKQTHHS